MCPVKKVNENYMLLWSSIPTSEGFLFWKVILENLKHYFSIKLPSTQSLFSVSENCSLGCHLEYSVNTSSLAIKWTEQHFTLAKDEMYQYIDV